ncbi:hypothetical protein [Streptomyces sp. NPDC057616]|uniref:hypothetical protein n=1 Tax=Streptomyces sp. NPDC057616 TaxID=3346183 RepID=UPI00368DF902
MPARAPVDAEGLEAGCCGRAGTCGFERAHLEVGGHEGVHLAELLASGLPAGAHGSAYAAGPGVRPAPPGRSARTLAGAGAGLGVAFVAAGVTRGLRR